MQLYKEYLSRHKINVPIVQYDRESVIFLRSKSPPIDWRIISFIWKQVEHHPGYFEYYCFVPVHNVGDSFKRIDFTSVLYWDLYEESVLDIVKNLRKKFTAISKDDHFLTAWKMFLYSCDTQISHLQIDMSLIESSIRPDIDKLEQFSKQQEVEYILSVMNPKIYGIWKNDFVPFTSIHSKWLEDLINQ